MTDHIFDVILIGRGPVGLSMAALLSQGGHSVAFVERHRDLYGLPRAGHIDHEIVRILHSLDAAEPVLADSYPTTEYIWKNASGETLLDFDWGAKSISGYNSDYMQFQPILERALSDEITKSGHVTDYAGFEVTGFTEAADTVEVSLSPSAAGTAGEPSADVARRLTGRYLVAADGASSFIRRSLGIEREDLGFNESWLVVDVRKTREFTLEFDCGQICDPARPITVLPLGKRHRRWEWAMLKGETAADLERPTKAWELLAPWGVTPANAEIVRQLVYTFEARLALEWRRGRTLLIGDACHTMPPFMGQGMCSGIRDAKNLAWKLDLVLRGVSEPDLLDTYQTERFPHVRDWTLISLEAGKIPCTLNPEVARKRDERFRAGWRPPMPDFPKLTTGLLDGVGASKGLAGELSLQGRVGRDGVEDLFDALFPSHGFTVISVAADPRLALSAAQLAFLKAIGTSFAHIGAEGNPAADAVDLDGDYRDYFARHGVAAVVNRPDFYVYGAVARQADLPALVDRLMGHLVGRVERPAARATADAERAA